MNGEIITQEYLLHSVFTSYQRRIHTSNNKI